jgi:murein DD-endopeptidase / murein LD-carboxypeptidase
MKIHFTVLLMLLNLLMFSQVKKHKHPQKKKVDKLSFEQYYANYHLKPDSANSPYLYSQVYSWVGTHYKYSGETKQGIDCSGFVAEMYRNVYCIDLPESSRAMWPSVTPVEKSDLKEGDILFFKIRKGQISHVGIFLENNKFAHASVKTGVIISDLDEAYYKKYFYKGGRTVGKEAGSRQYTVDK